MEFRMTDIKCRAWVQSFKKYLPVVELRFYKSKLKVVEVWNKGYIAVDAAGVNLELSTGLKDKNNKEIYEGDIVKVVLFTRNGDKGRYKKAGVEEIGCIGFEEGSFKICFENNEFGEPTSYLQLDDLHWETYGEVLGKTTWYKYDTEVYGNVHENPELLAEKGSEG